MPVRRREDGPQERVRQAVELALTEGGLRPPSGHVLVALSGGPDSRVLLEVLVASSGRLALTVSVCVVDHGLRPGSAREAAGALELARRLGVRGSVERVQIPDRSARSAREARYVALARAAIACGAQAIALGHTASDQAETLIDHLLRGAGSRGLGAMAPRRNLGVLPNAGVDTESLWLIRPLLEVTRTEIEAYVSAEGLAVVRDPSNEDLRFRRSRIRQRLIPTLREERADLEQALVRLCERLRLDAEYLDAEAGQARARITIAGQGAAEATPAAGSTIDLGAFENLHPAIGARVLRAICEDAGVPGDRIPLDALLRLSRGRHGTSQIDLPQGLVAERRYARLRIGPPDLPPADGSTEITVSRAGTVEIGSVALRVPRSLLKRGPLILRRPRRGDRVQGRRLSDVLVDEKVARPDRPHLWALAEPEGGLHWVGLLRSSSPGEIAWEWPSFGKRPRPVRTNKPTSLKTTKPRPRRR